VEPTWLVPPSPDWAVFTTTRLPRP
jgi:hypothetical protein